jgi:hypothetical protein
MFESLLKVKKLKAWVLELVRFADSNDTFLPHDQKDLEEDNEVVQQIAIYLSKNHYWLGSLHFRYLPSNLVPMLPFTTDCPHYAACTGIKCRGPAGLALCDPGLELGERFESCRHNSTSGLFLC